MRWWPLAAFAVWTWMVPVPGVDAWTWQGGAFWASWTHLGDTVVLAVATLVVAALLAVERRHGAAFRFGAGMLVAWALVRALKLWIARPRPVGAELDSFAYPSGHATASLAFVLLVADAHRLPWPARMLLVAAAVLVGLSRVAIGVHHPSDVVGGWLLAIAIAALMQAGRRLPGTSRPAPDGA